MRKLRLRGRKAKARPFFPTAPPIELRMTKRLSTAQAKVGDAVEFEVVHDVKVGDLVVVPRHSLASGAVVLVKPRRRPMRNAELRVDANTARSINGSEVALRGTRVTMGNLDPARVVSDSGILWPVLPFVTRGERGFRLERCEVFGLRQWGYFFRFRSGATEYERAGGKEFCRTGGGYGRKS